MHYTDNLTHWSFKTLTMAEYKLAKFTCKDLNDPRLLEVLQMHKVLELMLGIRLNGNKKVVDCSDLVVSSDLGFWLNRLEVILL